MKNESTRERMGVVIMIVTKRSMFMPTTAIPLFIGHLCSACANYPDGCGVCTPYFAAYTEGNGEFVGNFDSQEEAEKELKVRETET